MCLERIKLFAFLPEIIEKSTLCVKAFGRLKSLIDEFGKLCNIIFERLLSTEKLAGAGYGLIRAAGMFSRSMAKAENPHPLDQNSPKG
jgi:hypothetical protein